MRDEKNLKTVFPPAKNVAAGWNEERDAERVALECMENDVRWLLSLRPDDHYQWLGTKIDLAELVHRVFTMGCIKDDAGLPVTYRWLMTVVCRNLHLRLPVSINNLAYKSKLRKGVRQTTYLDRYIWALTKTHTSRPIMMDVRQL